LLLGEGIGVDAVVVVAMSAGAAMIGSAFGPTNPFQAGIALKVAQLPPFAGAGLRVAMLVAALLGWVGWSLVYSRRTRAASATHAAGSHPTGVEIARAHLPAKHALILTLALSPMAAYVYGALRLDWGFNELSAAFLIAGSVAGLAGGLGAAGTLAAYLEGMQS